MPLKLHRIPWNEKRERERERERDARTDTIDEQVLREMDSVKVLTSLGPVESAQGGTRSSTGLV
jgi:hypothetical protein